jgi:hypothetical protein
MASGALSLGSRRIGKRVRFPHGPATVMVLEAADPRATDLCSGRPSAARARVNRTRTRETESGDLPASLTASR